MVIYCPYFLEQELRKGKFKLACTIAAKLGFKGDHYSPKDLGNPIKKLKDSEELLLCIACQHPPEEPLNDCPQKEYYENDKFHKNIDLGNYLKQFGY